jgi:hypothetical protein
MPTNRPMLASILLCAVAMPAFAQRPDAAALMAAQKEAMARLASMDGVWRGPASTVLENGKTHAITQTERIGPFLDGTVKVLEGKGYEADGKVSFNAFGTVYYDVNKKAYFLHSHAMGQVGDFPLTPTADGYVWEIQAGPVLIRYTCTIRDGVWHEVGDRIMPGKEPVRFFEMTLKRVGESSWPMAGAVAPN